MLKKKCNLLIFLLLYLFGMENYAAHLRLESPAFANGSLIPKLYTCEGADVSPPLFWQNPPSKTQSYVLVVDDVDAPNGDWAHWLLFNIPSHVWLLSESTEIPTGAVSGQNSWGQNGYKGPCPPGGKHHYFFRLFALDTVLNLDSKVTKPELLNAMAGHILETSELIGFFAKD